MTYFTAFWDPLAASRRLPDAPHRAAQRSYPKGKSTPMKQVIINADWYTGGLAVSSIPETVETLQPRS